MINPLSLILGCRITIMVMYEDSRIKPEFEWGAITPMNLSKLLNLTLSKFRLQSPIVKQG
jgi:hypothetical protein